MLKMNNFEKILFYSDGMDLEEISKSLDDLIIQKRRWLGSNHPDSRIRKLAFQRSNLSIGEDVHISQGMVILDDYSLNPIIEIGDRCAFGNNVSLIGSSAPNNAKVQEINYIKEHCMKTGKIKIKNDCWIGSNVTILPGIHIGEFSTVGAGSIVTRNIEDYTLNYGVPCRLQKQFDDGIRKTYEIRKRIKEGFC